MFLRNVLFLHDLLEKNADASDEDVDDIANKLVAAEEEAAAMKVDSNDQAADLVAFCIYLCDAGRNRDDLMRSALTSVRDFLLKAA